MALAQQLPLLYQHFQAVLHKTWTFDVHGIANCPARHTYYAQTGTPIACQDDKTVVIDPNWFFPLSSTPMTQKQIADAIQNQTDTIVHELLRGLTLQNTGISENSLFDVFNSLTQSPLPNVSDLQKQLRDDGFGFYMTSANMQFQPGSEGGCAHRADLPSSTVTSLAGSLNQTFQQQEPESEMIINRNTNTVIIRGGGSYSNSSCIGLCLSF